MNYAYNGHLLEDERINLVAKEIINKYPLISLDNAKKIAMLEGKISTDKTLEIEFTRLYNIMLVSMNNRSILANVYIDLVRLLNGSPNDERIDYYTSVTLEIAKFINGERDFPFLDEFNEK